MNKNNGLTKHRYVYLDGIRGVAALFVLMRHTLEFWDFSVYRSYLAVDIFFILSGFVISNAYAKKMETGVLPLKGFFLVRIIRLYPVYLISLCFAIPLYLYAMTEQATPLTSLETMGLVTLSLLFLPGVTVPGGLLFPINGPYWSLHFELIANFLYGIFRPLLSTRVLCCLVAILGVLLLGMSSYHGSMDFGFILEIKAFIAGLVRASFGIFFGILIHSQLNKLKIKPRPWLAVIIICGVFLIPGCDRYDYLIDSLALLLVFPLCVILAASTSCGQSSTRIMLFLGSASYPLYVLHEPIGKLVLLATNGNAAAYAPYSGWLLMLLLVPLSSFLENRIDTPIRRKLSRRLFRK